jgi:PAS domain S-box-containing protein
MTPEEVPDTRSRVLPLISDAGNRQLLVQWIADHPSYEAVEVAESIGDTDFDVCIIDQGAFEEHLDALRAKKTAAAPVMLPYLLLLPESGTEIIDTDAGRLADNVVTEAIDEIVALPIQQAELHWRLSALLRLREQSLTLRERQQELERQLDLFEKAQNIANIGAWEYDIDAEENWWTKEVHRIYRLPEGTTPSSEEGLQYYHPEDRPIITEAFETAVEEGEPYDVEVRLIDAEDNRRWVRTRGEPQYEDGEVTRVRGTIQDITERKEREERLTRRTQAIDDTPVGISIADPDREDNPLIYVNDAFVEMTGYPREEALGRNCRFLQGENTDLDKVARIREAIDAEEPVSVTLRNYRKDGTGFWNHLEIAPVRDDTGEVVNWIGFQQDVTERKQRQEQLGVLDRVLRHNLRNDINMIRGYAETIQSDTAGDIASFAGKIVEESNELLGLAEKERQITELLRAKPTREKIEVCERLQQITSRVEAEHPEATITVECSEAVTVRATTEFGEAITELVTNAIVHNDASSPAVTLTVTPYDETVRIEIADTGPRIPEMERNVLVSETEQTPLYHGSGLGLWLVYLIITRSNGTITLAENSPAGNIVSIELPQ